MILVPRPGAPRIDQAMTRRRVLDLLGRLIEWRTKRGSWTRRRERIFWRLLFGPHGMPEILEWTIEQGWEPPKVNLAEGLSPGAILNAVKAGNLAPLLHFFPVSTWTAHHYSDLKDALLAFGGGKWQILETLESNGIRLPKQVQSELLRHWIIQAGLGRDLSVLFHLERFYPIESWPKRGFAEDFWAAFLTSPLHASMSAKWWADNRLPVPRKLAGAILRKLLVSVFELQPDSHDALLNLFPYSKNGKLYSTELDRAIRECWHRHYVNLGAGLRWLWDIVGLPVDEALISQMLVEFWNEDRDAGTRQIRKFAAAGVPMQPFSGIKFHGDLQNAITLAETEPKDQRTDPIKRLPTRRALDEEWWKDGSLGKFDSEEWQHCSRWMNAVISDQRVLRVLASCAPAEVLRTGLRLSARLGGYLASDSIGDEEERRLIWLHCIRQSRSAKRHPLFPGKLMVLIEENFPLPTRYFSPDDGFDPMENPIAVYLRLSVSGYYQKGVLERQSALDLDLFGKFLDYLRRWTWTQEPQIQTGGAGLYFWRMPPIHPKYPQRGVILEKIASLLGEDWFRLTSIVYQREPIQSREEPETLWAFAESKGLRSGLADLNLAVEPPTRQQRERLFLLFPELPVRRHWVRYLWRNWMPTRSRLPPSTDSSEIWRYHHAHSFCSLVDDHFSELTDDPGLCGGFWEKLLAPKESKDFDARLFVEAAHRVPINTRHFVRFLEVFSENDYEICDQGFQVSKLKVIGDFEDQDLQRSLDYLQDASDFFIRIVGIEIFLVVLLPHCKDLHASAAELLEKLHEKAGRDLGFKQKCGKLELRIIQEAFCMSTESLLKIYNTLSAAEWEQPTLNELDQLGADFFGDKEKFDASDCSFRVFVERLRQAKHFENIKKLEMEIVVDLGEGRTLA